MACARVKYVSRKVSKIRWSPVDNSVFITGSYDDDENKLTVWELPRDNKDLTKDTDPKAKCSEKFPGCVTDLKLISGEFLLAASSLGSLLLYEYSNHSLKNHVVWDLHHFNKGTAALTAIATKCPEVTTVGEDGRLCEFYISRLKKLREIECPDQCSITAATYIRSKEVAVGNSLGYLKVFDLRSPAAVSSSMLVHSRSATGISSINIHPGQNHVLATGNDDGSMNLWDMRQNKQPISVLEGHTDSVSELQFHPTDPDFIFTCSLDGSLLEWNSSVLRNDFIPSHQLSDEDIAFLTEPSRNPWLTSESYKNRLKLTSLFSQPNASVNTLDVDFSASKLLWATNNEAIFVCNIPD